MLKWLCIFAYPPHLDTLQHHIIIAGHLDARWQEWFDGLIITLTDVSQLQKWGGAAAIYEAVAYIAGMVVFLLAVDYASAVSPADKIAVIIENQAVLAMTNVVIYVLFGVALVV